MKPRRILANALGNPAGLRFAEAQRLAEAMGFRLSRVKGSHHIYIHPGISELLNLQDVRGMAKAYQVRQLLKLAERYNLSLESES